MDQVTEPCDLKLLIRNWTLLSPEPFLGEKGAIVQLLVKPRKPHTQNAE